jgi:hypothetical protein
MYNRRVLTTVDTAQFLLFVTKTSKPHYCKFC